MGAGLCWLWLGKVDEKRAPAVAVVRAARNMLRRAVQLGEHRVLRRGTISRSRKNCSRCLASRGCRTLRRSIAGNSGYGRPRDYCNNSDRRGRRGGRRRRHLPRLLQLPGVAATGARDREAGHAFVCRGAAGRPRASPARPPAHVSAASGGGGVRRRRWDGCANGRPTHDGNSAASRVQRGVRPLRGYADKNNAALSAENVRKTGFASFIGGIVAGVGSLAGGLGDTYNMADKYNLLPRRSASSAWAGHLPAT